MPILTNVLGFTDVSTLTIASGVVTVTQTMHVIAAESATSDDLDTINISADIPTASGSTNFRTYILLRADSGDTITVKHGTGNISLGSGADYVLSGNKTLQLLYTGSAWVDLQSSAAAAGLGGSTGSTDNALLRADGTGGATLQASGVTVDDSDNVSGVTNLALDSIQFTAATELTIATGAVTITQSVHTIDTEADAATDDLVTISGGATGDVIYLRAANDARTVVLKNGTGNILTYEGTDVSLDEDHKVVALMYNGTNWLQIGDGGGSGETNTASNVGTAGVGIFKDKSGVDLRFKKLNAGSSKVTITDDTGNDEVDIDIAEANLTLDSIGGTLGIAKGGTGQTTAIAAFDALAPTTTKGDIIAHDGTDNIRLAAGTNGYVLMANSGETAGLEWAALDAADIQSGTFDAARIPNLDAAKITSGIINIARIPTIPAANVSAGTFPAGAFTFTTSVTSPIITATNTSVATEGANVAVNGTFDVDANWTKGTGWSIGAGVATKTAGTQSDLSQSVGQAANQVVRVRFDYTRTAGVLSVILGGTIYPVTYSSASGSVDIYITATNTAALIFRGDATFAGTIDNVQVNLITARTQALQVPFAGTGNLGLGSSALVNVTSGQHNIANGQQAGYSLTTGNSNNLNGFQAGYSLTTGNSNNLNGYRAGFSLTTGYYNNLNGYQAGFSLTTGYNNNLNGFRAGYSLTTGNNNNINGFEAGYSLTTGVANNINGIRAGYSLTTGTANNINGYRAGYFETASNLLIFAINDTSTPPIRGIMSGVTSTIVFHSQNISSNVFQVQGIASQTGDLTRWNDSTGSTLARVTANGNAQFVAVEIDGDLNHDGANIGFYGTAPAAKGTVTGSRGGNAALASLLTALANIGLITDSSTA